VPPSFEELDEPGADLLATELWWRARGRCGCLCRGTCGASVAPLTTVPKAPMYSGTMDEKATREVFT
jgi:hypothetical protein